MSIFSLNNDIVRLIKIMNNLVKDSEFQSHFSVFKIVQIFPIFFSVKNIWLDVQLSLMTFFWNHFSKSDDDII